MARPTKAPGYGPVRLRKDRRTGYYYARFAYRGKREQLKLTGPGGVPITKLTGPAGAEKHARELAELLEAGKWSKVRNRTEARAHTFADLVAEFVAKGCPKTRRRGGYWAESTRRQNQSTLNLLVAELGEQAIGDVDAETIDAYLARLRDSGLSKGTRNRHLAILKVLLGKAQEWGYTSYSAAAEVRTEKVGRKQEAQAVSRRGVGCLAASPGGPPRAIATVYLETGLRRGELMKLGWADVDLAGRTLTVRDPKNEDDREIPLSAAVHAVLTARWQEWAADSQRTQTVDPKVYGLLADIRQVLDRAMKRLHISNPRMFDTDRRGWLRPIHSFRDYYGTALRNMGVDLDTRAELMGHRDLQMTKAYGEAAPNAKRDAIARTFDKWTGT